MSSPPSSAENSDPDTNSRPTPDLHEAAFVATSHDILDLLEALGVENPSQLLANAITDGDIQNYRATEQTDGKRQVKDSEIMHAVELLNEGSSVATTSLIAAMIGYETDSVARRLRTLKDEGQLTSRLLGGTNHWRIDTGPDMNFRSLG